MIYYICSCIQLNLKYTSDFNLFITRMYNYKLNYYIYTQLAFK